jgi:methylglutaconyl-CoA hydratase
MLEELLKIFTKLKNEKDIRVVVITGNGKSFCSGADISWMREANNISFRENVKQTSLLSEVFYKIYTLPKPTIARVNGAAIGGGVGFIAVCDFGIAVDTAIFGLSEVKFGLIPACVSPYLIRKIGETAARELILTGERFTSQKAKEIGLITQVVEQEKFDSAIKELIDKLKSSGPNAIKMCKEMFHKVPQMKLQQAKKYTSLLLAKLRINDEVKEGTLAFFEKRKPKWAE